MFRAPDVKGWRGHTDWLTVATLQVRYEFLQGLQSGFDSASEDRIAEIAGLGNMNSMYGPADFARDNARLWMRIESTNAMMSMASEVEAGRSLLALPYQLR